MQFSEFCYFCPSIINIWKQTKKGFVGYTIHLHNVFCLPSLIYSEHLMSLSLTNWKEVVIISSKQIMCNTKKQ